MKSTDLTSDLARRLAQHSRCSRFSAVDRALLEAVHLTRETPNYALPNAITEAKAALADDDSHDAIRDSLIGLMETLGEPMPDCDCGKIVDARFHADTCPMHAWEKP